MANKVLTYVVKMDIGDGEKKVKDFRVTLKTLEKSEQDLKKETDDLAKTLSNKLGVAVDASIDKSRTFKSNVRDTARETGKANREIANISREFKLLEDQIGKSADEQQILNAQYRLGAGATQEQKDQVEQLIKTYQAQRDASLQTQQSMRGLRGQAQNIGYQFQDIAVQAQMGTDAMVIFGQQGSQLAAGFGATGALIGAGIAIGAAGIGVLTKSLGVASETTKEFKERVKTLVDELNNLADIGKTSDLDKAINADIANEKLKETNKQIENTKKALESAKAEAERENYFTVLASGATIATQKSEQMRKKDAASVRELEGALEKLNKTAESYQKIISGATPENVKASQSVKDLIKDLELQVELYGESAQAIELEKLAREGADKELIDQLRSLYKVLDAKEAEKEATEKAAKEAETEAEARKKSKEALDKYLKSITDEYALLGATKEQEYAYQAALKTTDPIIQQRIIDTLRMIDAKKADMQATEDATRAEQEYWNTLMDGQQSMARTDDPAGDFIKTREQKLDAQYKKDIERVDAYYAMEAISFEQAMAKRDELEADYLKKKEAFSEKVIEADKTIWEQWAENSEEALNNTDELMFESMDRFVSGTADAFASAIVNADNFGDAMKNVFLGATQAMISYFAELAIQQALMWAFKSSGEQTAQAGAAAQQSVQNEAVAVQAGLNALQSMAGAPFPMNLMAPAFSATTFAQAQAMAATSSGLWSASAAIPTFDKGGYIPSGGAGIVSEFGDELVGGTMVYNGSPNSLSVTGREETARRTGGGGVTIGGINVYAEGNASPDAIARAMVRILKKPNKAVDNAIFDSTNRGRKNGGKRFA